MIKKLRLLLTIAVSMAGAANAQTITPYAGVVASSNSVDLSEDGIDYSVKPRIGFTLGANYEYKVGLVGKGIFSVQGGLAFIQKGVKSDATMLLAQEGDWRLDLFAKESYTINYLEIPITAKYELGAGKLRYHFFAGPSIAYGLGGKYKADITYTDDYYPAYSIESDVKFGDEPSENEEDMYFNNRIDIGLQFGAGVNVLSRVNIDLKYGLGLTDLMDNTSSKNRVWQLTVGVPLTFK